MILVAKEKSNVNRPAFIINSSYIPDIMSDCFEHFGFGVEKLYNDDKFVLKVFSEIGSVTIQYKLNGESLPLDISLDEGLEDNNTPKEVSQFICKLIQLNQIIHDELYKKT